MTAHEPDPSGRPYARILRVDGRGRRRSCACPARAGGEVAVHPYRLRAPFSTLPGVLQYQIRHRPGRLGCTSSPPATRARPAGESVRASAAAVASTHATCASGRSTSCLRRRDSAREPRHRAASSSSWRRWLAARLRGDRRRYRTRRFRDRRPDARARAPRPRRRPAGARAARHPRRSTSSSWPPRSTRAGRGRSSTARSTSSRGRRSWPCCSSRATSSSRCSSATAPRSCWRGPATRAFRPRYRRRMAALAVLGVLHAMLLFAGDILLSYALLGLLLLPARRLPDPPPGGPGGRDVRRRRGADRDAGAARGHRRAGRGRATEADGLRARLVRRRRRPAARGVARRAAGAGLRAVARRAGDVPAWGWRCTAPACSTARPSRGRCCAGWCGSGCRSASPAAPAPARSRSWPATSTTGAAAGLGLLVQSLAAPCAGPGLRRPRGPRRADPPLAARWSARSGRSGRMSLTAYLAESLVCSLLFNGYGLGWYGEVGPAGVAGRRRSVWAGAGRRRRAVVPRLRAGAGGVAAALGHLRPAAPPAPRTAYPRGPPS